jgi:hypothetical protein
MQVYRKISEFRERASAVLNIHNDFDIVRELFSFQATHNLIFGKYLDLAHRKKYVDSPSDLTFLPVEVFKSHKIQTLEWDEEILFKSSGTTSAERSHHYVDRSADYHSRVVDCLEYFLDPVDASIHLAFLPFYMQNPNSSLIEMMRHIVELSKHNGSQFVISEKDLDETLYELRSKQKVFIWTVTYGLLDFVKKSKLVDLKNITFIETGGMKGTRVFGIWYGGTHVTILYERPDFSNTTGFVGSWWRG